MDEQDEPERIEIELTSHEPSNPVGGPVPGIVAEGVDPEPGPLETERGRLIAVGSGAAILALLLGVVVGRAGGTDGGAAASAVTTAAPSTSVDAALTTIEPPATIETAPPTTQRRAVTTTVAGPRTESIEIAPIVAEQPIQVVALLEGSGLVMIDAATGSVSTVDTSPRQNGGPESVRAGDGWIMLPSYDGGSQSTLYLDDGTEQTIDTGPGWTMRGVDGSDNFWRFDEYGYFPSIAVEHRYDGTATGRSIELPDHPLMVDPLGGFAVSSAGGVYLVDEERTTRLTAGRLLALGVRRAVVQECDESLQCEYVIVERATGERRTIEIVGLEPDTRIDANNWFPVEQPLDPAETALVVSVSTSSSNGSPVSGVVDLQTGQVTELGNSGYFSGMKWTPDGRFLLWLRGGQLEVFDPTTGESVKFSDDLGFVNSFTIRPAIPSIDRGAGEPSATSEPTTAPSTTEPSTTEPSTTEPSTTEPSTSAAVAPTTAPTSG